MCEHKQIHFGPLQVGVLPFFKIYLVQNHTSLPFYLLEDDRRKYLRLIGPLEHIGDFNLIAMVLLCLEVFFIENKMNACVFNLLYILKLL